jgi:hypothetical protein
LALVTVNVKHYCCPLLSTTAYEFFVFKEGIFFWDDAVMDRWHGFAVFTISQMWQFVQNY